MVFATTCTEQAYERGRRRNRGTFATDARTGDIDTKLLSCEDILVYYAGDSKPSAISVHETLPIAGSAVTVDVDADSHGHWIAWGY